MTIPLGSLFDCVKEASKIYNVTNGLRLKGEMIISGIEKPKNLKSVYKLSFTYRILMKLMSEI
jgi:hypothetical protein